jgi:hypothetical protein
MAPSGWLKLQNCAGKSGRSVLQQQQIVNGFPEAWSLFFDSSGQK